MNFIIKIPFNNFFDVGDKEKALDHKLPLVIKQGIGDVLLNDAI
jgi:hypothetical protein